MALPDGSLVEVKVGYVVNNQRCFNVLHYRPVGSTAGGTPAEIVASFLALNGGAGNGTFIGEFKKVMGSNVELDQVTAQVVFPIRYALQREVFGENGLLVGAVNAQNVQSTIQKRGELGNRHNLGSIHIGGMPDSELNSGLVNGAQVTRLETLKTFLLAELGDGLTAAAYRPVILNKVNEPLPDGSDHFVISGSSDIVEMEVKPEIRTQRTRTLGRGI